MNIRKKLLVSFLFIGFLVLVISGVSRYSLQKIDSSYLELIERREEVKFQAKEIEKLAYQQSNDIRGFFLFKSQSNADDFYKTNANIDKSTNNALELVQTQKMKDDLNNLLKLNENYKNEITRAINMAETNPDEGLKDITEVATPLGKELRATALSIVEYQTQKIDEEIKANKAAAATIIMIMNITSIIAVVVSITLGLVLSNRISRPITSLVKYSDRIASGDLAGKEVEVSSKDEIGHLSKSFNRMSNNLRELIKQVGANAEQVAASSGELSASAEETSAASIQIEETMQRLAQGVTKQVKSVEETSYTINEMSIGIQHIAENSLSVSNSAISASEKATEGGKIIDKATGQMNSINEMFIRMSDKIKGLGDRSIEIGNIISVITGISEQTNLLALNASIEAARAGEHGRGFAVVADEVRKLAEQSAHSAEQITRLIETMQKETSESIETMAIARSEVSSGTEIVNMAGSSFKDINEAVSLVTNQIQEVSAAVQEMVGSSEQMAQSIQSITLVVESTESGTQEVAASSQQQAIAMKQVTESANYLSNMADELQKHISSFKI